MKKLLFIILIFVAAQATAQEKTVKFERSADTVSQIIRNTDTAGITRYLLISNNDTSEVKNIEGKLYFTDVNTSIALEDMAFYTNATPVPYTVGNILAGSTFTNKTFAEVLNQLLYTEVPPTAALTGGATLEYGDTNLYKTLNWTATKGSESITGIAISNTTCVITPTGNTQTGTCNDTLVQDVAQSYTITVAGLAKTGTATTSFAYRYANYYGAITQDTATFYGLLRTANQPSGYLTKILRTTKAEDHDYNCTGGKYIYVLYPASYGNPTTVKNGVNDFSDYTITNITITDDWGVSRSYKAFSVNSIQTGASVNISIQ